MNGRRSLVVRRKHVFKEITTNKIKTGSVSWLSFMTQVPIKNNWHFFDNIYAVQSSQSKVFANRYRFVSPPKNLKWGFKLQHKSLKRWFQVCKNNQEMVNLSKLINGDWYLDGDLFLEEAIMKVIKAWSDL